MKDRQTKVLAPIGGLPILSPVLHVLAMPGVIFLRYNFGYSYLSPKSIFLPVIFTSCVAIWSAVHSHGLADRWVGLAVFSVSAAILYLVHLFIALVAQWTGSGEHDQFSGTSLLAAFVGKRHLKRAEIWLHSAVEPALILTASILCSGLLKSTLSACACSLALKELINHWLILRMQKRDADSFKDAEERGNMVRQLPTSQPPVGRGRIMEMPKERVPSND